MKNVFVSLVLAIGIGNIIGTAKSENALVIGAIPDQNPERINRLYKTLSGELSKSLDVRVEYKPVTNYPSAVTAFRTGDLDLVWFGGLTGVQARLQTQGAKVIAQRDIDAQFHSVFIANTKSQIPEIKKLADLKVLKGRRFTFGSESSTSGRLMPQHFLNKAGVKLTDFKGGRPGFSGSHDATLALVQSSSYEAGALNEEVWKTNLKRGKVNTSKVKVIWRTTPYFDYHWLAQGDLDQRFGKGFTNRLTNTILSLNKNKPKQREILELFSAKKFIPSKAENYNHIERIAREIGKIN